MWISLKIILALVHVKVDSPDACMLIVCHNSNVKFKSGHPKIARYGAMDLATCSVNDMEQWSKVCIASRKHYDSRGQVQTQRIVDIHHMVYDLSGVRINGKATFHIHRPLKYVIQGV